MNLALVSTTRVDSMLDGTPTLRMNEFVLAALEAGKISLDLDPATEKPAQKAEVEELEFVLDDKAEAFIEGSKKAFATELKRHDLKVSPRGGVVL
jgi:carnitine O-acetyltransferase